MSFDEIAKSFAVVKHIFAPVDERGIDQVLILKMRRGKTGARRSLYVAARVAKNGLFTRPQRMA